GHDLHDRGLEQVVIEANPCDRSLAGGFNRLRCVCHVAPRLSPPLPCPEVHRQTHPLSLIPFISPLPRRGPPYPRPEAGSTRTKVRAASSTWAGTSDAPRGWAC